ncbi:MAG TPA: hypothetical protein VJ692_05945 [Nitrospiraceae bacterium]|nr:hypothetical protein [Nitrospiraceae bacterium]
MARGSEQYRSAWLGGEAHVRYHNGRSVWSTLLNYKHPVALTLAFLAGAAIGSSAAALVCARRLSEGRADPCDKGGAR